MANSADPDQLADLDLHCLQRQGISGFSRTRVKGKNFLPLRAKFYPLRAASLIKEDIIFYIRCSLNFHFFKYFSLRICLLNMHKEHYLLLCTMDR